MYPEPHSKDLTCPHSSLPAPPTTESFSPTQSEWSFSSCLPVSNVSMCSQCYYRQTTTSPWDPAPISAPSLGHLLLPPSPQRFLLPLTTALSACAVPSAQNVLTPPFPWEAPHRSRLSPCVIFPGMPSLNSHSPVLYPRSENPAYFPHIAYRNLWLYICVTIS